MLINSTYNIFFFSLSLLMMTIKRKFYLWTYVVLTKSLTIVSEVTERLLQIAERYTKSCWKERWTFKSSSFLCLEFFVPFDFSTAIHLDKNSSMNSGTNLTSVLRSLSNICTKFNLIKLSTLTQNCIKIIIFDINYENIFYIFLWDVWSQNKILRIL